MKVATSEEIQKACDDLMSAYREARIAAKRAILKNLHDLCEQNEKLKAENEGLKDLLFGMCRDVDRACEAARPCTIEELQNVISHALRISRQHGLSEALKEAKNETP